MTRLLADEPPRDDLTGLTKAQLLIYANEHGVEGVNSQMQKAEIYKIIKENDK